MKTKAKLLDHQKHIPLSTTSMGTKGFVVAVPRETYDPDTVIYNFGVFDSDSMRSYVPKNPTHMSAHSRITVTKEELLTLTKDLCDFVRKEFSCSLNKDEDLMNSIKILVEASKPPRKTRRKKVKEDVI